MNSNAAFAFHSLLIFFCAQAPSGQDVASTLASASLPTEVKQDLARVVEAELASAGDGPANRENLAYQSQVRFFQLRQGSPSAVFVEPSDEAGLCAPNGNGNCPFWLFLRRRNRAVLVVDGSGQDFSVQHTSHNGMHDVAYTVRIGHTPLTEDRIELHFEGKQYKAVRCTETTSGGDEQDTKVPPHPCATTEVE